MVRASFANPEQDARDSGPKDTTTNAFSPKSPPEQIAGLRHALSDRGSTSPDRFHEGQRWLGRDKPEDAVLKLRQVEMLQGQGLNRSSRSSLTLPAPPHRKSFWRHHLPRLIPVFFDSIGQRDEDATEEKREDVILKGLGRTLRSRHTPPEGEAFAVKYLIFSKTHRLTGHTARKTTVKRFEG